MAAVEVVDELLALVDRTVIVSEYVSGVVAMLGFSAFPLFNGMEARYINVPQTVRSCPARSESGPTVSEGVSLMQLVQAVRSTSFPSLRESYRISGKTSRQLCSCACIPDKSSLEPIPARLPIL